MKPNRQIQPAPHRFLTARSVEIAASRRSDVLVDVKGGSFDGRNNNRSSANNGVWASTALLLLITLLLLAGSVALSSCTAQRAIERPRAIPGFQTNEETLAGLYNQDIDPADSIGVFRRVFASLRDEVTMYPTENYYYFSFTAKGKSFWGSISLFPHERESGIIGFGYTEKRDKHQPRGGELAGGWGSFGAAEGISMRRFDDGSYGVTCDGRQVRFRFNRVQVAAPKSARLLDDEEYVLPCFDESGLQFALLFNRSERKLYWILDEDRFVPETFTRYGEDLVIGDRTEFAFFNDTANNRKVLVGAEGYNVLNNNWYDGPFDQLPDNYIVDGQIELRRYIELAHPNLTAKIDRVGRYNDNPSTRVAIAPYLVYFSIDDMIASIEACRDESGSMSRFLSCITQQVFIVPENAYSSPVSAFSR